MTALNLNRLGEREIAALIDGVTGNKPLPANIRQDIIERTDGIPLFVEEMTKAVLEAGGEGDARASRRRRSIAVCRRSRKPARLADGAARPARFSEGGRADRSGHRAGVLPFAPGCGGPQARSGTAVGARPSRCSWLAIPAGRAAARDLSVQARAGAGRRVWHAAARAATRPTRPYRRNARKQIHRDCREPA